MKSKLPKHLSNVSWFTIGISTKQITKLLCWRRCVIQNFYFHSFHFQPTDTYYRNCSDNYRSQSHRTVKTEFFHHWHFLNTFVRLLKWKFWLFSVMPMKAILSSLCYASIEGWTTNWSSYWTLDNSKIINSFEMPIGCM